MEAAHALRRDDAQQLLVLADGQWITFAKSGVGGKADILVMRANGTGVRPLTRTKVWDGGRDWGAK